MASNKALQSTQHIQPTYLSQQQKESPEKPICEVSKTDNPPSLITTITFYMGMVKLRKRFTALTGLQNGTFEMLVIIAHRWVTEHKGSTVYYVAGGKTEVITTVSFGVRRLYDKGLLEVIGIGNANARLYAPTKGVLDVLSGKTV